MAKKRRKTASATEIKPINIVDTLRAEIEEAVELMSPHFPDEDDNALRNRAMGEWRRERYHNGGWPDFAELAKAEAEAVGRCGCGKRSSPRYHS
jgi:hypothetical protein